MKWNGNLCHVEQGNKKPVKMPNSSGCDVFNGDSFGVLNMNASQIAACFAIYSSIHNERFHFKRSDKYIVSNLIQTSILDVNRLHFHTVFHLAGQRKTKQK